MKRQALVYCLMTAWVVCCAAVGEAAVRTWTGASSSDWSAAGNWAQAAAPVNGDDLVFVTNMVNQPVNNNIIPGLAPNSIIFTNVPSGGVFLGGGVITNGAGGLTNFNTTAGRIVVVSNAIAVTTAQSWGTANSVNAVTILLGNLSGSGNIALNGQYSSNGTGPAPLRLGGNNSGYTGTITPASSYGLMLLGPASQPGGIIDLKTSNQNGNLWLTNNTASTPYTFGIGGSSGAIVQFRGNGTAGLFLMGGDVYWDPGNGGSYTWATAGTGASIVDLNGTSDSTPRFFRLGNTNGNLIVSGGNGTIRNGTGGNYAGQAEMLYALADDATGGRTFTSSAGLLLLTRPAVENSATVSKVTVSGGAVALQNMDRIFDGGLDLSGGVLVLDGVSWANFTTDRSGGFVTAAPAANQWRINSAGGGFAARGTAVTIDATGTSATTFDRDFTLGSSARDTNGALYANAPVVISRDTTLANAARTVALKGGNLEAATGWTIDTNVVHELSGVLSGGGASASLTINGTDRQNPSSGILRIGNTNNTYSGVINVEAAGAGGGGGIAIFSGDGAFGAAGNVIRINSGSNGDAGMLLLENAGAGTNVFTRNIATDLGGNASGGDSGFGSWQGRVRYDGVLTVTGTTQSATLKMPIHVQSGILSFGVGAAFSNNHSLAGTFIYYKTGPGELDLRNLAQVGVKTDRKWVLCNGVLTVSASNQLTSVGTSPDDVFSAGATTVSPDRRLQIRDSDVAITYASGGAFNSNTVLDVEAGRTFTTFLGANQLASREYGPNGNGFNWGLRKVGGGAWVYASTYGGADYGRLDGYVKIEAGTFDVNGKLGRTSIWLSGGILLAGTNSPFEAGATGNRLRVDGAGGKIGVSTIATVSVSRSTAFDGINNIWDLAGTGTVTLASRGDLDLRWNMAAFPDIAAGETLVIARDGAGTGVVQIADTAWTNNGTLAGVGALRLGTVGNGTGTVNGVIQPGGTGIGTLSVQGTVAMSAATTNAFEFAAPGTCDCLAVTGNLILDGTLTIATNAGFGVGTYTLMTYGGTLFDNGLVVGSAPSSYTYAVAAGAGVVQLMVKAPDMGVLGNGASITNGDNTPSVADATDLGSISVDGAGGAYAERTFAITNSGSGTLTLSGTPAVSLGGAGTGDFSVVSQPAVATVSAHSNVAFTVRFDPLTIGGSTVTVSIANNDAGKTPFTFALRGVGVGGGPTIGVLGTNGASIANGDLSPAVADGSDFGTLAGGSADHVFVITNSGSANLTLDGAPLVALSGANTGDFVVVAQPADNPVLAGAGTPFTLRFMPKALGLRQAVVSVANNDSARNPYTFAVQGTYAGPDIAVLGTNGATIGSGDATPSAADGTDFGSVAVFGATRTMTYTITNAGLAALTLTGVPSVGVSGANAADFMVTTQPVATNLLSGGVVTFSVAFDPSAWGARAATLAIASDDPDTPVYTFALAGAGILPSMGVLGTNGAGIADGSVAPVVADGTDYGSLPSGASDVAHTFTITNSGPAALVLTGSTSVVVAGANAGEFLPVQPSATTLVAGASVTFGIRFVPQANGLRSATVLIGNNDPTHDPYDFAVQGTGVPVTRTWTGSASTNWSVAGNWAENQAPGGGNNLVFTQGNPPNAVANNDLTGLNVQTLIFSNGTFASGLTLAGNAIMLAGGLTNGNTTGGRTVTVNNNIAIAADQAWGSANDTDAVTVINGNLSGTNTITLAAGYQSNGGALPNLRLGGTNSAFTGTLTTAGSDSFGVEYLAPSAQIGGFVDLNNGNRNLWLAGSAAANPYTFGIGIGPGKVLFRSAGTAGLYMTGGDEFWDPGAGASYAWTNSGSYSDQLRLGGTIDAVPRVMRFGNASGTLTLGQNVTLANATGGNYPAQMEVGFALADDPGGSRSLTTSFELLMLTRPSVNDANPGTTVVSGGALAITSPAQLFDGNLNLSGGVLVLDGVSWAAFTSDRSSGYGTGTNAWQLTGGGFAARTTAVTIDTTQTTPTTFDRDFRLGTYVKDTNLALYANAAVTLTQDIALNAVTNRTITVSGQNNEVATVAGSGSGMPNTWAVLPPVHQISGKITGGATGRQLLLNGNGNGNNGPNMGGTLRIANPSNDFLATNVLASGGGNFVVIAPDDGVFGNAANAVVLGTGGSGPDSLVLFEDQGGHGKAFGRALTLNTGDNSANRSGFGSYAGQVLYTGNVTRVDASGPASTVLYANDGSRLTLGSAASPATITHTGTQNPLALNKEGNGDLVLSNVVYSAGSRTQKWVLVEGTLATTLDPSQTANSQGGQLRSAGPAQWIDLVGGSGSTNAKAWIVRGASQTYSNMAGAGWSGGFALDVGAGLTLRTLTTSALTAQEGAGVDATPVWDMVKTGSGTWVFLNNNTTFIAAGRRNNVRIDQGTFDVTGDMGRSGLTLNGGTLLTGSFSPFTDSGGTQRLLIGPGGGKIGLSTAATASVMRASAMAAWDQTMTQTVTFAARDNYSLAFGSAVSNVASNVTVLVERDGAGTGEVRFANASWSVAGTLGGSGTLRLTGAGTRVVTNSGTLYPGSSASDTATLTLTNTDLVMLPGSTMEFDLAEPGNADLAAVNGNLTLAGNFVFNRVTGQDNGTYEIMRYSGTLATNAYTVTVVPASPTLRATVDTGTTGHVFVVLTSYSGVIFKVQ